MIRGTAVGLHVRSKVFCPRQAASPNVQSRVVVPTCNAESSHTGTEVGIHV